MEKDSEKSCFDCFYSDGSSDIAEGIFCKMNYSHTVTTKPCKMFFEYLEAEEIIENKRDKKGSK